MAESRYQGVVTRKSLRRAFVLCKVMYLALLDMMFFAVAQNDAARFARNDALFALMCPQARISAEGYIIRRSRHHLPVRANIVPKKYPKSLARGG